METINQIWVDWTLYFVLVSPDISGNNKGGVYNVNVYKDDMFIREVENWDTKLMD